MFFGVRKVKIMNENIVTLCLRLKAEGILEEIDKFIRELERGKNE